MNESNQYVFDVDWSINFPGKDQLLKFKKFPPQNSCIYITTRFWPFSMERQPKILTTGRTKPIKARIVGWDNSSEMLGLTLERYITVEENVKSYPFVELKRLQFHPDFKIG